MSLKEAQAHDIWNLREQLLKEYRGRDTLWDDRRKIRFREMGQSLRSMPLNPEVSDHALLVHQTEVPNDETHKRVKRLIANPPRFEVVLMSADPDIQGMGQQLEHGIKALYPWIVRGKRYEWLTTENQQGDGIGLGKLDWLPDHGASLKDYDLDIITQEGDVPPGSPTDKFRKAVVKLEGDAGAAFDSVTTEALMAETPPVRLSAVNPRSCAWWEDGDGISLIVEHGKKLLNPLLAVFKDYGLTIKENRLVITETGADALAGETIPAEPTQFNYQDLGQQVLYTEIRTRDSIVIMIEHPDVQGKVKKGKKKDKDDRGVIFRFENPFGPYSTGYSLIPGNITDHADVAHKYQPVILGLLNDAQPQNVLMTARLSAATAAALAPKYIKVNPDVPLPAADESKAPGVTESAEITAIEGEIKVAEGPNIDLDKAEDALARSTEQFKLQEALQGGASSEASGHRLAVQVSQADIQMVPYQNARADSIKELMKAIIYAVRKHGLPIFVPTLPNGRNTTGAIRVSEPAIITPEMADLPFDIIVQVGAETPVTKYAKWSALADREERGTAGYQTVVEQSDVDDPEDEIGRVFEGKLLKATMEQLVPTIAQMAVAFATARLEAAMLPGGGQGGDVTGVPADTGLAGGGGAEAGASADPRLPGIAMPVQPTVNDEGPRVQEGAGLTATRA